MTDTLSKQGAFALAMRLSAHWVGLGYSEAEFRVQRIPRDDARALHLDTYVVRSNLVNGLPPGKRQARELAA